MATYINGKRYEGNSVSIINGKVYIDGVPAEAKAEKNGILKIKVEGILGELKSDVSVECGEVRGNVSAGGSVQADAVHGSVNAGGSVQCDNVGGNVMAGGSVQYG